LNLQFISATWTLRPAAPAIVQVLSGRARRDCVMQRRAGTVVNIKPGQPGPVRSSVREYEGFSRLKAMEYAFARNVKASSVGEFWRQFPEANDGDSCKNTGNFRVKPQ
jgi:hypothetical protein